MLAQNSDFDLKSARKHEKTAWQTEVPKILAQIKIPKFSDKSFIIKDLYTGNNARDAINQSIKKCHEAGGGKVIIPAGEYLVKGSIFLLSNVNLHLEKGAILRFSTDPKDYLPVVKVRWEGTVCYNYSPLIYAYQADNLAITGEGLIDGQTELFFHEWKKLQEPDKKILRQMGNDLKPENERIFGEGHLLRPDGIQLYECKNILFESFTIKSSPFWTIHPVFCENITARNLTIRKGTTNDDGFDPESCKNVWIENCNFDTVDDCIAVKAGRDQDAWNRQGTENIVIRNCVFKTEVGSGFCIGSEMSGGVRNVFVENCTIESNNHALNFKCNKDRGGFMEKIYVRNIQTSVCKHALTFTTDYHSWRGNNFPTRYNDFYLSNLQFQEAKEIGIKVVGLENKFIERIYFNQIKIAKAKKDFEVKFAQKLLSQKIKINQKIIKFDN
ncbi:MAG: glycoside hydrolase family 28 protein [Microscillaceae bacterium]|nr:glycoside hydrolase family 28 protein [Microscillaceae bacterium]